MQRAGATGATAPESATAADLGKTTMDLEKDIEWLDTRGGGEYQIRIGRIKSVQEDQEHCLIPETPSPNAKMSGKERNARCPIGKQPHPRGWRVHQRTSSGGGDW